MLIRSKPSPYQIPDLDNIPHIPQSPQSQKYLWNTINLSTTRRQNLRFYCTEQVHSQRRVYPLSYFSFTSISFCSFSFSLCLFLLFLRPFLPFSIPLFFFHWFISLSAFLSFFSSFLFTFFVSLSYISKLFSSYPSFSFSFLQSFVFSFFSNSLFSVFLLFLQNILTLINFFTYFFSFF